ncbi:MAG TPA: hypothetical protein VG937_13395 [Polyangiaceae bacterium]|jgi:hypothetical protein|nr:hypothetical protein [Polyangiaceae bacterium]
MKPPSPDPLARDQLASPFSAILQRLCESCGAQAAALVDAEGETVDYAGRVAPFDARVAAAEWRLVLAEIEASKVFGWTATRELLVRAGRRSFAAWALADGYAIVLILPRHAFRVSRRALAVAAAELELEAGLDSRPTKERVRWLEVKVLTDERDPRRPRAVWQNGAWCAVTVLGRFQSSDLGRSEVGYLTRFDSGAEGLLIREPLGNWFCGEPT